MSKKSLVALCATAAVASIGVASIPSMISPTSASASASATALAPAAVTKTPVKISDRTLTMLAGKTSVQDTKLGSASGSARYDYSVKGLPSGKSAYTRVQLRKNGQSYYSVVARTTNGGNDFLQLERVVQGRTTVIKQLSLGKNALSAARSLSLEVVNEGGYPKLTATQRTSGRAEQTLTMTDRAADRLTAGTLAGVSSYLQGGTAGKVSITYTKSAATAYTENAAVGPGPSPESSAGFKDDFLGSAVDATKWKVRDGDYMSYDWAYITKSNVTQRDGNVTLATHKLDSAVVKNDGRQRWHSAAYMDTMGKHSMAYGTWEIRAKLPTVKGNSQGIWPAFWLRPDDVGNGEIDIFEAYGSPTARGTDISRSSEGTLHYEYTNTSATKPRKVSGWTPSAVDVNDGQFHTWTFTLTRDKAVWALDGKDYFTVKSTDDARWKAVFGSNRKWNMRLNVQVGSEYWGRPAEGKTAKHTEFVVDYVKATPAP